MTDAIQRQPATIGKIGYFKDNICEMIYFVKIQTIPETQNALVRGAMWETQVVRSLVRSMFCPVASVGIHRLSLAWITLNYPRDTAWASVVVLPTSRLRDGTPYAAPACILSEALYHFNSQCPFSYFWQGQGALTGAGSDPELLYYTLFVAMNVTDSLIMV